MAACHIWVPQSVPTSCPAQTPLLLCLSLPHLFFFLFLSVLVTLFQHHCCCIPPSIAWTSIADWPLCFFCWAAGFSGGGVTSVASASTKINAVSGAEGVNILYCTGWCHSCVLPTRDALDRSYTVNWPFPPWLPSDCPLSVFSLQSKRGLPYSFGLYFTSFGLQSAWGGWRLLPFPQCTPFSLSISWFPCRCLLFFLSLACLHISYLCFMPRKMLKAKCPLFEMARAALLSLFKTSPRANVLTSRP